MRIVIGERVWVGVGLARGLDQGEELEVVAAGPDPTDPDAVAVRRSTGQIVVCQPEALEPITSPRPPRVCARCACYGVDAGGTCVYCARRLGGA